MERSCALRSFNNFETELNEHFWSFKVISEYSRFVAQQEKDKIPTQSTRSVFNASGPDARRIPPTVSDWLAARGELENWLRAAALVSAAAFHETYLRQIARCALMSNPLVRHGLSKQLDGVHLLKKGREIAFEEELKNVTKGDWSSRRTAFGKLFGEPDEAAFPIKKLEAIRKIRNNFAHGFGRDLDVPSPIEMNTEEAQRLCQKTFMSYMAVLSKSAAAIDELLLKEHIGSFELLYAYHQWRQLPRKGKESRYSEERAFQRYVAGSLKLFKSTEYCGELILFYKQT